jgi:restriction system protein
VSEPAKVYLTRAGKRGEDEEFALEHGSAVIGFQEVPSLEGAKDYDAVLKIVRDSLPTKKPRAIGNIAGQLWAFAVAMNKDDLVVLPRKLTSQVAIGRVKGSTDFRRWAGICATLGR